MSGTPLLTDGRGGQSSLIYSSPLAPRWSVSGFADLNWNPHGWVVGPQLNYRLSDRYRLAAQLCLNEFEQRGSLESTGAAFRVEATF